MAYFVHPILQVDHGDLVSVSNIEEQGKSQHEVAAIPVGVRSDVANGCKMTMRGFITALNDNEIPIP